MDLIELRQSQLFSQSEAAIEAGIEQSTLSKVEAGVHAPQASTLRKLAEAYDVDFADIRQAAIKTQEGKEIHA